MPTCIRSGCSRPTWNGQPGKYCSKSCREGRPSSALAGPLCALPGCSRPTWNGQPGKYCSLECKAAGACQAAGGPQCILPGCSRPTWNGQPGKYCSLGCKAAGDSQSGGARCIRSGCSQPTWNGQPGKYCSFACRDAQTSSSGQTFVAYHGTSMENAQSIQRTGFQPSSDGCLGRGVYFADWKKAARFAHKRGQGSPAVLKCQISVRRVKQTSGNDDRWQREGYDACYTSSTSASTNPEWCILSPNDITVLEVQDLQGMPGP